jgi:hypothetical protein
LKPLQVIVPTPPEIEALPPGPESAEMNAGFPTPDKTSPHSVNGDVSALAFIEDASSKSSPPVSKQIFLFIFSPFSYSEISETMGWAGTPCGFSAGGTNPHFSQVAKNRSAVSPDRLS